MKIHESLFVKGSREATQKNYDSLKLVPKIQLHLPITLIWSKAFISSEWNESSWMCSPVQMHCCTIAHIYPQYNTHTHTLLRRWIEKLLPDENVLLQWKWWVLHTAKEMMNSSPDERASHERWHMTRSLNFKSLVQTRLD